jgi:hypothetical protein
MVFIREDEQTAGHTKSRYSKLLRAEHEEHQIDALLQGMERGETLRVRKTIVLAAMNDQLRR